jgi:general secretion pathway protein E
MTVNEAIRAAVHPTTDLPRLRQLALQEGMRPLRLAGAMKVAEGITTLEEVLRATPAWE